MTDSATDQTPDPATDPATVERVDATLQLGRHDTERIDWFAVGLGEGLGNDRAGTAPGAPAQASDDEEGFGLGERDRIERATNLTPISVGDRDAQLVIGAGAVAPGDRLADQDPVLGRYQLEPVKIGSSGVDGRRRRDEPATPPAVVLQELVEDFTPCLTDADGG